MFSKEKRSKRDRNTKCRRVSVRTRVTEIDTEHVTTGWPIGSVFAHAAVERWLDESSELNVSSKLRLETMRRAKQLKNLFIIIP